MKQKFETSEHVIAISAAICALGCYILVCWSEQFRLCALGKHVSKVLSQKGVFFFMTMTLGGVSLFAMNCLNLTALRLPVFDAGTPNEHRVDINFKVVPLSVSVFIACVLAFGGLCVASRDPMFAKSRKEIIESFIADAKCMTMREIKSISSYRIFQIISTRSLWYLVGGGVITGSGAVITSCLCMWSLAIPDVKLHWHIGGLIGTILFSWFFSTVAFWILFRLLSLYPRIELLRFASALFMSAGFVMTYVFCDVSITLHIQDGLIADDSVAVTGSRHLSQEHAFVIILCAVVVFCFVLLVVSVVDLRGWLHESNHVVHEQEHLLNKLKGMHADNHTVIARFQRESGHALGSRSSHQESSNVVSKSPSLLDRSLGPPSASAAVDYINRLLPVQRGKVSPQAEPTIPTTPASRSGTVCRVPSVVMEEKGDTDSVRLPECADLEMGVVN